MRKERPSPNTNKGDAQEPRTFNEQVGITSAQIMALVSIFKKKSVDEVEDFHGDNVQKPTTEKIIYENEK